MKKIILLLSLVVLLISCSSKDEVPKVEPKEVLENHFKQETLKKLNKFDKNNTREKVESMTWFLCTNETITHPWTNISITGKNCKQEDWDKEVYFKIKWNSFYKVDNKEETEIIKIHTKPTTEKIWDFIVNNIVYNFKNVLEQKYCKYLKIIKKETLKDDENKEIFIIQPVWHYKTETDKQLRIDPNIISCEWFYPDLKKFIIYDITNEGIVLEVRKDNLIDYNTLKYN